MGSGKTFAKVLAAVVVILLIVAIIGVVFALTNGFTDDFKTFYVEYGDKILAKTDTVTAVKGSSLTFNVHYIFDSENEEAREYSVRVLSNCTDKTAFQYKCGDDTYFYTNDLDLTESFALEKGERGFILTMPYSMREVLEKYHGGKAVEVSETDLKGEAYFKIVVTPYNGKNPITVSLLLAEPPVQDVELDKSGIVFGGISTYQIGYRVEPVRGSGGDDSVLVEFSCEEKAAVNAKVTFTYSCKGNIFDPIALYGASSGFLKNLTEANPPSSGTVSFVMPTEDVYILFSHVG